VPIVLLPTLVIQEKSFAEFAVMQTYSEAKQW